MANTTTIKPFPQQYSMLLVTKEVSELGAALRKDDPDAKARLDRYNRFMSREKKDKRPPERTEGSLSEGQTSDLSTSLEAAIVAREYGFTDWDTISSFIEGMNKPGSPVRAFEDAVEAIINGDEQALSRLLRENPSLAQARSLRVHQATLLHYTAANGIEGYRQRTPANIVVIARLLLEAGAEVDAPLIDGGNGTTLGMVATSIHSERKGVQLELMELLLDAGAAVDGLPNGWQPMMAALANGRPAAAALLADRGSYMTVVAAAGLGRRALVRSFFTPTGEYIPTKEKVFHVPKDPERQLMRAFMYACIYGQTAVAAWLIERGVDPGVQDDDGYTGLHWAGHGGHVELVQFLLSFGVPLELKNCHGGTVLGQVLWSASNNAGGWGGNKQDADYPAIAALLIDAGSVVWRGTLAWWRGLQDVKPAVWEEMEKVLLRHAAGRRTLILSAVSRHLVVGDIARSLRYYTETLGFEKVDEASVAYGPAALFFHTDSTAVDSTGELPPAGEAMVFFQVDDLNSWWDKLYVHNAGPTMPEKINWIKYRMLEVRDPDGNRLWFGQSYHEEAVDIHTPPGTGQLRKIMPALPCVDVGTAVSYYRDVLGFSVNYQQDDLGVMDRDEVRVLLVARKEGDVSTGSCCVYIRNADELHAELTSRGALVQGEPVSHPWGLRDFVVKDPDGNEISFAQTFE
ncbi:MAG TPA: VOC family protein [Puia sp.]|nr:VOC family protein [Puia sp.]